MTPLKGKKFESLEEAQAYRVMYREARRLLEELADATLDGKRKELRSS
jgi:hypothetical protein